MENFHSKHKKYLAIVAIANYYILTLTYELFLKNEGAQVPSKSEQHRKECILR